MEPSWVFSSTALVTSLPVPPWRKATVRYHAARRTAVEWATPHDTATRVSTVKVGIVFEHYPSVFPWKTAEPDEWIEIVLANESDESRPLGIRLDFAELWDEEPEHGKGTPNVLVR